MNNSNVNGLSSSHNGTSTTAVNGVHRTSSMNGQYMDTSPSGQYTDQREYVNGGNTYNPSQVIVQISFRVLSYVIIIKNILK